METIKVNMSPNPLDVQTIHASQNDGEAREWGFELHNNGELIDTSEVTEQMVFKAYKGGTEQLLPENGSVPTTAPFLGDIRYPQGLLTDQEFTYRQSPTEEDGLAYVVGIKGQTLKWNQLANISDSSFTSRGITVTTANGKISYSGTTTAGSEPYIDITNSFIDLSKIIAGHKYLISVHDSADGGGWNRRTYIAINNPYTEIPELSQTASRTIIFTPNATPDYAFLRIAIGREEGVILNGTASVIIVDITQMGLDSLTDEEILQWFADYFPLNYYPFNRGSLIPFMGNGLKTVGKNLLDPSSKTTYDGENGMRWYQSQGFILMANKTYTFSASNTGGSSVTVYIIDHATRNALASSSLVTTYTPTQNVIVYFQAYRGAGIPSGTEFQLEIGSQTSYEPYTSSTTNLPISTYFPTGMKQAGNVYDELTPTKGITRIGAVDLGSLTWSYNSTNAYFTTHDISSLYKVPSSNLTVANIIDPKHTTISANDLVSSGKLGIAIRSNGTLMVKDTNYTDAATFKTAMSGVYLYYELATPIETPITTASLVTETTEIPLSNEDGTLIGKCTEQLSSESGFFDAKIKLADADGECYSNKIQLHIERSPQ